MSVATAFGSPDKLASVRAAICSRVTGWFVTDLNSTQGMLESHIQLDRGRLARSCTHTTFEFGHVPVRASHSLRAGRKRSNKSVSVKTRARSIEYLSLSLVTCNLSKCCSEFH